MAELKKNKMYQINVTGAREHRSALITKFEDKKSWSVAYFYDCSIYKADEIVEFKSLTEAKFSATCHVDI